MPRKPAELTANRTDILLAAAKVFYERGYHGAKMEDISREVGLTAGSLYHHFPAGKQEILLAVLNEGLDKVSDHIDVILRSNQTPDQKLRAAVEQHVNGITGNVSVGSAMVFEIRTMLDIPAIRAAYVQRRDRFESLFRAIIQEGVDQGVFAVDDVNLFVRMILGAHNWVGIWYKEGGPLTGQQIAIQMSEWFLAALRFSPTESNR